ncbi:MAG: hypothetical protein WBZ05_06010 [Desulfobacterales bacterium]
MEKPFTPESLIRKIREIPDTAAGAGLVRDRMPKSVVPYGGM